MGKHHFPKFFKNRPLSVPDTELYILQGQSLHPGNVFLRRHHRHQGRQKLRHMMPGLFGHPVAVPGGSCGRIGNSSGGHKHRVPRNPGAVLQHKARSPHAFLRLLKPQGLHTGFQMNLHPQLPHPVLHGQDDVRGVIGLGKHPAAPLHLRSHAQLFKEIDHVVIGIAVNGAVKKPGIGQNRVEKLLRLTGVGEIAPALPGDKKLLSQLLILFENVHLHALSGRVHRRQHAGCPASDNQ